jgi:hypothetical protein
LDEVINIKNKTIGLFTNKTPNKISFNNSIDKKEIERINNLMLKSQKSCNVYKNYYQIGKEVLINNNIIKKVDEKF